MIEHALRDIEWERGQIFYETLWVVAPHLRKEERLKWYITKSMISRHILSGRSTSPTNFLRMGRMSSSGSSLRDSGVGGLKFSAAKAAAAWRIDESHWTLVKHIWSHTFLLGVCSGKGEAEVSDSEAIWIWILRVAREENFNMTLSFNATRMWFYLVRWSFNAIVLFILVCFKFAN